MYGQIFKNMKNIDFKKILLYHFFYNLKITNHSKLSTTKKNY